MAARSLTEWLIERDDYIGESAAMCAFAESHQEAVTRFYKEYPSARRELGATLLPFQDLCVQVVLTRRLR